MRNILKDIKATLLTGTFEDNLKGLLTIILILVFCGVGWGL